MIEELIRCGLTQNEAKVYLTCLQLGRTPAAQIVERSSMPRGTVYDLLNALDKMGLVTSCRVNKRLYFTANDPGCLMAALEERRDAIAKVLPALKRARGTAAARPSVQTLEGNTAICKLLDELLTQSGEVLIIGNLRSALTIIEYPLDRFTSCRLANQSSMRQLTGDTQERLSFKGTLLTDVRLLASLIQIKEVTLVSNDTVCSILFQAPSAFKIQSKEHAEATRRMFEQLWDAANSSND